MNSYVGVQPQVTSKLMLCPCCGASIELGIQQCACGARFVGLPLDETPIKVQRLGAALTSMLLLALVVGVAAVATKWLAPLALIPIWCAWRAMRLAKRDPAGYGGFRIAATTFTIAVIGSSALAVYGVVYIPRALENRHVRSDAATRAVMYHYRNFLEDYRRTFGSYPRDTQEIRRVMAEAMPTDYWDAPIRYRSYTELLATSKLGPGLQNASGQFDNYAFELRSPGPDGIEGTDDDIIMLDGVFYTSAEIKKQPIVRNPSDR